VSDPILMEALAAGRAAADARMTETIVAGVETEVPDPVTLETITVLTPTYSGPAMVKYPTLTVSDQDAGGQQYTAAQVTISLPSSATPLPPDTIIKPTASTVDQSLIGRRYRVTAAPQAGQTTAHRHPVEELN